MAIFERESSDPVGLPYHVAVYAVMTARLKATAPPSPCFIKNPVLWLLRPFCGCHGPRNTIAARGSLQGPGTGELSLILPNCQSLIMEFRHHNHSKR
jgi:hypothetical protein